MMNYLKSEGYRILHSRVFYVIAAVLSGATLLMNLVLALCRHVIPDFRYGTFRFSLNTFTSMTFSMVVLGAVIAGLLFADDRKCSILKNAISYGIPRRGILLGKCVSCLLSSLAILLAVSAVYISSAWLLLADPEWLPLQEMLTGMAAALPSAIASMVLAIVLDGICQQDRTAALWWVAVFYLVPLFCSLVGLKVELLEQIASWMPYRFLRTEAIVSYSNYLCLWDTPAGMAKCLAAGLIGILLFLLFGFRKFQKQEF